VLITENPNEFDSKRDNVLTLVFIQLG